MLAAASAQAGEGGAPEISGFYGGVALRSAAVEGPTLAFGPAVSAWTRYAPMVGDDSAQRALVFGGYRFRNNVALEAAFSSADRYALRPEGEAPLRRGVGLLLVPGAGGVGEVPSAQWNVDLFTSWTFYRSFALYGRLGYGQTESHPLHGVTPPNAERRLRDGVNYGVGLRYDMNRTLGLRLEYGRYGRYTGEIAGGLLDSDQVSVGVQFRF